VKPLVTLSLRADGELELWLNHEGRDLLVRKLMALDDQNDHLHMMPPEWVAGEIVLSQRSFREADTIITSAKVLLRSEDWYRTRFPDGGGDVD